ncbi:hypothetical protein SARC_03597 [Sphaeroforma arctica JP610]|uniref:FAD-binding FR-type domain-containing protein n=1 Tax=Sphaeroforma arctica JP610 TaxID=667725 RepID=A0A0L0G571_9EUKA|nr:hypothetical protein SARC_03597 [Sphaeroforma arctica JP610]KNC84175.1 hypothetical protein SARC_03597 [Sphaeroforma arctica JP610]|eukprot:XP_014158077.1 hypothetical protein SARC_03597 [Sphaeroforma arctica JP610]
MGELESQAKTLNNRSSNELKKRASKEHAAHNGESVSVNSYRRNDDDNTSMASFQPTITIEDHPRPRQLERKPERRSDDDEVQDFPELKNVGLFTRLMYNLRVNGRLWTWILLHAIATLSVFFMFFIEKWRFLDDTLPTTAPNYWPKKLIPCFEFGAMHSLLFQMSLLPISMCKYFITVLRSTRFKRLIPFDYFVRAHIYLGYQMGIQLIVSLVVFVLFFGSLCAKYKAGTEPVNFCARFGEEIMITGYVIVGIYLVMFFTAVPAFAKNLKSYERFYYTHHLFIAMYFITILHTFDVQTREGLNRSQSWKWFVFPMTIYAIDRCLYIATRRQSRVLGAQLFHTPKTMVLTVQKPQGFGFRAGQYLFLNVPAISKLEMHPFSIGSTNDDRYLKLFITVYEDGWTGKLWTHFQQMATDPTAQSKAPQNEVIIMGPYGAPLQDVSVFDHTVLVCSGSGIVPMMSQLAQIISDYKTYIDFRPKHNSHQSVNSQEVRTSRSVDLDLGSATCASERLACRMKMLRHSNLYNLFFWVVIMVNFAFICLPFTWSTNQLGETFRFISCIEFIVLTGIYVIDFMMRMYVTWNIPKRFKEDRLYQKQLHLWQVVELLLVVGFLCAGIPAIIITKAYDDHTAEVLFLWCLAGCRIVQQIAMMFNNFITNAPNPAKHGGFGRGGNIQAISLHWICRSASQLSWLVSELAEIQEQCDELFGEYFLSIRPYVTGTNIETETIKQLTDGTAMEDRVLNKRPDWHKIMTRVCEDVTRVGGARNVGVLSCSNAAITGELAKLCLKFTAAYKQRPTLHFVDGGEHTITIQYNNAQKNITFDCNDTTKTTFGQADLKSRALFEDAQ